MTKHDVCMYTLQLAAVLSGYTVNACSAVIICQSDAAYVLSCKTKFVCVVYRLRSTNIHSLNVKSIDFFLHQLSDAVIGWSGLFDVSDIFPPPEYIVYNTMCL